MTALPHRAPRWLLTAALLALVATLVPSAPAHAADAAAHEARFVDSLNVERASRGLDRVRVAADLTAVARRHSDVMAAQSRLHHNPNLASDVSGWQRLSENVGRGPSVASIHSALMASTGHRANILDTRVTEVGVGVTVSGSTIWVTQVFRLPTTVQSATYRDVGGTHASSIARLADAGITTGCTASRYCPHREVTRAQMGTFLARSAVLMPSSSSPFRDLHRAPVHEHNVSALADAGVTGGCTDTRFCPNRTVTRGQMATFLANARGLSPVAGSRFTDVPADAVHAGTINAIADAGITRGCGDGRFCPDEPLTRAEMASFLVRAFNL